MTASLVASAVALAAFAFFMTCSALDNDESGSLEPGLARLLEKRLNNGRVGEHKKVNQKVEVEFAGAVPERAIAEGVDKKEGKVSGVSSLDWPGCLRKVGEH